MKRQRGEIITGLVMFWVGLICFGAAIVESKGGTKVAEVPSVQVASNYHGRYEQ